ncbi:MAG: hypothetical protein QM784_33660 [Polyangiaceae bacterium]
MAFFGKSLVAGWAHAVRTAYRFGTPSQREWPRNPSNERRRAVWATIWSRALVMAGCVVVFGPNLGRHVLRSLRPCWANDDARQQIFPFFRFEESGILERDYVTDYYLDVMPVLYRGLYRVAAAFDASILLSKLLPYLLLAVTLWAVGSSAFRLSGRIAAVTAICAVLGHHV